MNYHVNKLINNIIAYMNFVKIYFLLIIGSFIFFCTTNFGCQCQSPALQENTGESGISCQHTSDCRGQICQEGVCKSILGESSMFYETLNLENTTDDKVSEWYDDRNVISQGDANVSDDATQKESLLKTDELVIQDILPTDNAIWPHDGNKGDTEDKCCGDVEAQSSIESQPTEQVQPCDTTQPLVITSMVPTQAQQGQTILLTMQGECFASSTSVIFDGKLLISQWKNHHVVEATLNLTAVVPGLYRVWVLSAIGHTSQKVIFTVLP